MEITVANGAKMYCEHKCDGMLWVMQGKEFQFDMKVMEVGSYEGETCHIRKDKAWAKTIEVQTYQILALWRV